MSDALPTIILIHGAWHTPANYQNFSDSLTAAGFSVYCPHLPSCNNTSPPPASFSEDVVAVRAVVQERVTAGECVLMVMHSYGGMVGTDAVTDNLLRSTRAAIGQPGGVIHLLYQCAYILQPGTSIIDISKASGLFHLWPQFVNNFDDGSSFPVNPAALFLGDAEPADIEAALPHLVRSPLSAFSALSEGDCWKKLPVTYVHTSKDGSVPRPYQDIMIERAEKDGVVIKKEDYDTCHSVFVTKKKEMVDLALKAAKDERNAQ
ncbi:alpha/beta-hydrolase [Lindgomyces ingoldianus]|uniref:Alpha/beta-hydrolase n=1 Tax=Lindgomyces ingoldianus TaxID=673940 RepID=A0ACB6R5K3_9PLEO|nr:alpha/beta-hydrolase [Lindgomyces ingoldianus]KAF2474539.1 alpha/beta-hydrolase [Lindgomyces ingoldianus]